MIMDDLCRKINCKHILWNGYNDGHTDCLKCKLKRKITDENKCARCSDRVPKRREKRNIFETMMEILELPILAVAYCVFIVSVLGVFWSLFFGMVRLLSLINLL